MTPSMPDLLARKDFDLSNLLYLLVFIVLPLLNTLGAKLRKKFGHDEGEEVPSSGPGEAAPPAPPNVPHSRRRRVEPVDPRRAVLTGGPPKPPVVPVGPARPSPPVAKPVPSVPPGMPRPVAVGRAPGTPRLRETNAGHGESTPRRRAEGRRPVRAKRRVVKQSRDERLTVVEQMMREAGSREGVGDIMKTGRSLLPRRLDAEQLRRAIVLSEILQPPIALRDER